MYVNEPKKEMIKFSGRKGFVRAAVETGTAIVPVYQFGMKEELGHAMGKEMRASLAVLDSGFAKALREKLDD